MTSKLHFVFTRVIFEQILILDNDLKYLSVTNTWKQKELRKGVNTSSKNCKYKKNKVKAL